MICVGSGIGDAVDEDAAEFVQSFEDADFVALLD